MRVKILQVPGKSALPENRINPFSVPEEMKYGGAITPEKFGNRRIDTFSDFLRQPMRQSGYRESPYYSTGKELPDVPKSESDIVVEKNEQVMGDFNGDGMPVLMGVNTGSHESGNDQGINVPEGSFVFSDTPSLKIKEPDVLDMFGKKKPMTPAKLAKQYDLQKYKKVLDDPDRDTIDKNTAKLMYSNYVNKLNTLASVQEDKKQKQDMAKASKHMKKGGWADNPTVPYAPDITGEQAYLQATNPAAVDFANLIYGPPDTNRFVDSMEGPRTELVRNLSPDYGQRPAGDYIEPIATLPINQLPVDNSPVLQNYTVPMEKQSQGKQKKAIPHMNISPDTLAAVTAGLRYLQYPNYNPVRQVAHGAIPQAVFMDPTRAKAAVQEGVNSAYNSIAMGANGPIARANVLALQGKAGAQAADIEAQYAAKNAEIATRTNEQAAQIYNQLWKDQQGYNKEYAEEVHNAQMDKLGYQFGVQNELLKQAYMADNRKRTAHNYNYVNPYYTMDSRGYIYPKSEAQLKAIRSIGETAPSAGGSGKELELYKTLYNQAIAKGVDPARADKWAAAESGMLRKQSTTYDSNNPMTQKVRTSNDYDEGYKRGGPVKTKMKIIGLPSK